MRSWLRWGLAAAFALSVTACDGGSDDGAQDTAVAVDTGAASVDTGPVIGPGDLPAADALQPQPSSSCVGLADTNTIPQSLHDFCAEKLTAGLLAGGDTCFKVPKPDDPKGPYCVLCSLKGGTQKLCLQQVIP